MTPEYKERLNKFRARLSRKTRNADIRAYRRCRYAENLAVTAAHCAVMVEVKAGRMQGCGSPNTIAHHDSYAEADWLKVRWLCRKHHKRLHMMKAAIGSQLSGSYCNGG